MILNYLSFLKDSIPVNFIVTFFVIATKKVTKEKSRQTRSLRAFCLASATLLCSVILSDSEGSHN